MSASETVDDDHAGRAIDAAAVSFAGVRLKRTRSNLYELVGAKLRATGHKVESMRAGGAIERWLWYRQNGHWAAKKVIEIPAEPAEAEQLPPLGFKAVPPLIADINLSLDDRFLYVSCWGTGEIRQ
jgi:hypothetical protein